MKVTFCPVKSVDDSEIQYAVIVSLYRDKWVFCRHRARSTWEVPGGSREPGETILDTARRELYEETGAITFCLTPVCVYTVHKELQSHGLLCFAEITCAGPLPAMEIAETCLVDDLPELLTYPGIQPLLFQRVKANLHMLRSETNSAG